MWFFKILVRFFSSIDRILFNFINQLYELLISISRTSVLSQGDIADFTQRVELMLGIFMLFKISFSLITYIVNPDDFSDKSKGFGKLISRAVVSLVMLVIVPYVFQMAYNLQSKLLEGNVLAKLILGDKLYDSEDSQNDGELSIIDNAGQRMAFTVMLPFFTPNYSTDELSPCITLYDESGKFSEECVNAMLELSNEKGFDTDVNNYRYGIDNQSLGLTFRTNIALATVTDKNGEEHFIIDYKYLLSTATAVIVCLLLITFCIDVGLRSVKLAFLQLIYPIPVIGYMDPKSGGNDGMFKKWYTMCISTFLSLFLRLLALYFGIYIITRVSELGLYDVINGSQISNMWVKIFIIIGVLMFVKQLPKILQNLGVKLDGEGTFELNPLKKIEKDALGGKTISNIPRAAAGAAVGLGMGAVGSFSDAGAAKWITGAFSGFSSGLQGKKLGEIHKSQVDANQRMREAIANGSKFWGRRGSQLSNLIGAPTNSQELELEASRIDEEIKDLDNKMAPSKKQIEEKNLYADAISDMEKRAVEKIKNGEAGILSKQYFKRNEHIDTLKAQKDELVRRGGRKEDIQKLEAKISQARENLESYLNKDAMNAYIDANFSEDKATKQAVFGSDSGDKTLTTMYEKASTIVETYGKNHAGMVVGKADDMHAAVGKLKGEIAVINNENEKFEKRKRDLNETKQSIYERQRIAKSNESAIKR